MMALELRYRKIKLDVNDKLKKKLENCTGMCEHYLELCALDFQTDDLLRILQEEIEQEINQKLKDRYACPYCDFTSPFFNIVALHIGMCIDCSAKSQRNPCYPIQL